MQGKEAGQRILSIRQRGSSVSHYAVEFRILTAESQWNEISLQGAFFHGLNDYMKDELAARYETDNLESLIDSVLVGFYGLINLNLRHFITLKNPSIHSENQLKTNNI